MSNLLSKSLTFAECMGCSRQLSILATWASLVWAWVSSVAQWVMLEQGGKSGSYLDLTLLSVCWGLNSRTGLGLSLVQGSLVLRMPMLSLTALSDWAWACAERTGPLPNWVPDQFCYLNLNKRKAVQSLGLTLLNARSSTHVYFCICS